MDTANIRNDDTYRLFRPDLDNPTFEDTAEDVKSMNAPLVWCIDPRYVCNAVLFLASTSPDTSPVAR